jgi:hypothetical protein
MVQEYKNFSYVSTGRTAIKNSENGGAQPAVDAFIFFGLNRSRMLKENLYDDYRGQELQFQKGYHGRGISVLRRAHIYFHGKRCIRVRNAAVWEPGRELLTGIS